MVYKTSLVDKNFCYFPGPDSETLETACSNHWGSNWLVMLTNF